MLPTFFCEKLSIYLKFTEEREREKKRERETEREREREREKQRGVDFT